ncbi:hypothetical protein [Spongiimicrobium sp. 3-5]|uniref:hypothetical protein n=1 Tax=Spongiimicrobium sp. 3-5 TaxID=3332596 RepID=UPI0039809644
MKNFSYLSLLFLLGGISYLSAQGSDNFIEFNDRKNVVHGVYIGITTHIGEIDDKETYLGGLKIAYVANQQFEVGFSGVFFYSQQNLPGFSFSDNEDLIGAYGGLHLEPIFFSKSRVNLSFPILIGAGGVAYVDGDRDFDDDFDNDINESDAVFVLEPGANALFNISRYLQIEAGVRYRFSSRLDLQPGPITRINGFSAGLGIKVGVFNLGRNRYKKNIDNER